MQTTSEQSVATATALTPTLSRAAGEGDLQWPPAAILERNGIRLEPLTLAHEAGLREAAADGELWNLRVTSVPEPEKTRAYIEAALQQRAEGSRLAHAVIDIATGRVLGSTSYHDIIANIKRVEIGYTWYRKSVQRSHVNTTCKLMLMRHAFETLLSPVVGWRTDIFNFDSQRAIEKLGAKRDGVIRCHALRRDGTVRDTVIYSMLTSEWPAAKEKLEVRLSAGGFAPAGAHAAKKIRFVDVDYDNLIALHRLNPGALGSRMVAPNLVSVAQGRYSPNAWFRAIYVDQTPVGFFMLFDPTRDANNAVKEKLPQDAIYLWRLMIDFAHQGRGFGEAAVYEVWRYAIAQPAIARVTVSYVPEEGGPGAFYRRLGFVETGEIDDGELVMSISIDEVRRRLKAHSHVL
jgi:N-acetyltransferase